jgi:hypothetical protein
VPVSLLLRYILEEFQLLLLLMIIYLSIKLLCGSLNKEETDRSGLLYWKISGLRLTATTSSSTIEEWEIHTKLLISYWESPPRSMLILAPVCLIIISALIKMKLPLRLRPRAQDHKRMSFTTAVMKSCKSFSKLLKATIQ